MSKRTASWIAWSVCALSLALIALSFLLIVLILNLNTTVFFFWLEPTAIAVGYSVIGAILVPRLPKHPIGWICLAIGFLGAVEHFSGEYAVYALVAQPGPPIVGGKAALWLSLWVWVLMIGLIVLLLLLFPTGRLPSRRWRWFAWLSVTVTLIAATLAAISPDAVLGTLGPSGTGSISLPNPLGVEELQDIFEPVQALVLTFALVAAASLVVVRLRRARGVERQQIKWLIYAGVIGFGGGILRTYFSPLIGETWGQWVGYLVVAVGALGGPIAIGVAILRYRLYEIDLIINRTLVYGSLTATLALVYFVDIVVFQEVFRALSGQHSQVAIVASTLMIAALFNPLRHRLQAFIDQRFYRRKYDATKTLEGFGARLRDETDLETISGDLVGVVHETMQPSHVSVWLRPTQETTLGEDVPSQEEKR